MGQTLLSGTILVNTSRCFTYQSGATTLAVMDDDVTLHRRARLRELIAKCFNNHQVELLNHIQDRTDQRPNQGEMSALCRDNSGKSFGEKKARALVQSIGLSPGWFDQPLGTDLRMKRIAAYQAASVVAIQAHDADPRAELLDELVAAARKLKTPQIRALIAMAESCAADDGAPIAANGAQ